MRDNLASAKSFSECIKLLYAQKKEEKNSSMSIKYLSTKLGYKSKGHVYSILQGEKRLPLSKCHLLKNIFKLNDIEYNILYLLCSKEHTHLPSQKNIIDKQIRYAQSHYYRQSLSTIPDQIDYFDFSLIYSCLGLIDKGKINKEIVKEITHCSNDSIEKTLKFLNSSDVIEKVEHGNYKLTNRSLRVSKDEIDFSINVSKALISKSLDTIDNNYKNKTLSCYESSILSVQKKDYESFLPKLRDFIKKELYQLETEQGDMLIIANTQIFPYLNIK